MEEREIEILMQSPGSLYFAIMGKLLSRATTSVLDYLTLAKLHVCVLTSFIKVIKL